MLAPEKTSRTGRRCGLLRIVGSDLKLDSEKGTPYARAHGWFAGKRDFAWIAHGKPATVKFIFQ